MRQSLTILAVADLARSARFYETVFGWKRHVDLPVFVEFKIDGAPGVALYARGTFARNTARPAVPPTDGMTTSTELYIYVDDADSAVARAVAAGGELLSPAAERVWGDVAGYVADPDGNVLGFGRPPDEDL